MHTLQVELGDRAYPIYIGPDLLDQPELLLQHVRGTQVLVVTNETVAPLYLDRILATLSAYEVASVLLPDGEEHKNLTVLNRIFDELLSNSHTRSTTLVALGGGVVGDMCGFAAACYQRGVNFVQIPTTLLAQVDSSVGGKTGVNHALGKNMIGAFHQPMAVIIDTKTLQSLPSREFAAGMAEVIKYGLISDPEFYYWLQTNIDGLLARDEALLAEAIERSCLNKARVVAADEREGGVRAILNLGHTFGHAIETAMGYGHYLHGEAVAIGMVLAVRVSVGMGWLASGEVDRLRVLLSRIGLPVDSPENMTVEQYLTLMAVDKKVIDGELRLVLLDRIGSAVVTAEVPRDLLVATLSGTS